MSNRRLYRDVLIQLGGAFAIFVALLMYLDEIDQRWIWALFGGAVLLWHALLKAIMPRHSLLRLHSWTYLALCFVMLVGGGLIIGDWRILGWWTPPALIGIGLMYWLVHEKLGPRSGDDVRKQSD